MYTGFTAAMESAKKTGEDSDPTVIYLQHGGGNCYRQNYVTVKCHPKLSQAWRNHKRKKFVYLEIKIE